jgi:hypothetical protein
VWLSLQGGLFHSGFPTKILYEFISPMHAICSAYLILFDLIILIGLISDKQFKFYESPHYVLLFIIRLLLPSEAQKLRPPVG